MSKEYRLVETDADRKLVLELAEEMGVKMHNLDFEQPIFLLIKDGRPAAWLQVANVRVAFSGWSKDPQRCSPRDVSEMIEMFKHWAVVEGKLNKEFAGYAALEENHKTFTPAILNKLNFHRTGYELWSIKEGADHAK